MSLAQFSSLYASPTYQEQTSSISRFSGAAWFNFVQCQNVGIFGVGGIGSWLALLLSRLDLNRIIIMDDDSIDAANLGGQFFRRTSVNQSKVNEVTCLMNMFSGYYKVASYNRRLRDEVVPSVVFGGFDNMEARKLLYKNWKCGVSNNVNYAENYLLIDGRLSAEALQIFCIEGDDEYYQKEYEDKWLFSDEEAESTVCSYKQTSYCANLIASLMVNLFVNWCTNKCNPLVNRRLPFMTEYNAEQMFLKTIV